MNGQNKYQYLNIGQAKVDTSLTKTKESQLDI